MAKPLKILVVDDDRDVAEGLADILSLDAHEVELAYSFSGAQELLGSREFDLSFINVKKSGQSGVESYFEVCNVSPTARTVMTTGYTMEQLLGDLVPNSRFSLVPHSEAMDSVVAGLKQATPNGLVVACHADPNFATTLNESLGSDGRAIAVARYPEEASQIVARAPLDALILDLRQPILAALEVYIRLRELPDCPPIILCREAARQIGDPFRDLLTTGVLFKPFDPPQLLKALGEISEHKASRSKRPQPSEQTRPLNILIVDDDADLLAGIEELLSEQGHNVKAVAAFDDAVDAMAEFEAEVALIDVQIGWNNGLDLIEQLREIRPHLVPIVLTARADKDTIVAALRSGAHDYLTKPLQREELSEALGRAAERLTGRKQAEGSPDKDLPPEMLASISHDLRTPLNAVVGFSEILKDQLLGPLGTEKYVSYATDINQAGKLINDVLGHISDPAAPNAEGQAPADAEDGGTPPPLATTDEQDRADTPSVEAPPGKPSVAAALARFQLPSLKALKGGPDQPASDDKPEDPQDRPSSPNQRRHG